MKKILLTILVLLFSVLIAENAYNQCKSFAKKICKEELNPYIHDGNYNAAILTEGEDAELYKTFYAGQQYRIAICGSESLPKIRFQILDLKRKVLYDNKSDNYKRTWDFSLESSQQLIISVKVLEGSSAVSDDLTIQSGCVAIMFGISDN